MGSNKLFVQILIRVLLLVANTLLIGYVVNFHGYYFTAGFLLLMMVLQTWELVRFTSNIHRELALVFSTIRNRDFALKFRSGDKGGPADVFHAEINNLLESFRRVKIEKEQQFIFLKHMVDFLFTGIISYTEDGRLHLYNRKAQEILDTPALSHWSLLQKKSPEFCRAVAAMKMGEQHLLETTIHGMDVQLSMYRNEMKIGDDRHVLISFQNIAHEMEQKELESYQKLIRILTHEIMNSVTPMISISDTLLSLSREPENASLTFSDDLQVGLKAIHERSNSVLRFVGDYRSLVALPEPQKSPVKVRSIAEEVRDLFSAELLRKGVVLTLPGIEDAEILADAGQVKQVLINLVTNSMQALEGVEDGEIGIEIQPGEKDVVIRVTDNGPGIPEDKQSRIFIPFFTTKEGGSGVGLSLVRSIVSRHGGSVRVVSRPGKTDFVVKLKR